MLLISRITLVVLFSRLIGDYYVAYYFGRWTNVRKKKYKKYLSSPNPLSLLNKILLLFVYYFVYSACCRFEGIFLSKVCVFILFYLISFSCLVVVLVGAIFSYYINFYF